MKLSKKIAVGALAAGILGGGVALADPAMAVTGYNVTNRCAGNNGAVWMYSAVYNSNDMVTCGHTYPSITAVKAATASNYLIINGTTCIYPNQGHSAFIGGPSTVYTNSHC